jgi:hypothetical protein
MRPFRARARAAVPRLASVALVAFSLGSARAAHAEGDTTYGRVEGDVELAPAVGVTAATYGARPTFELRGRYLTMAGAFVTYEESFSTPMDVTRLVSTGIELRPLFFARWLQGHELGQATLDLLIDSFALELGAFFAKPGPEAFGSRMGLQASVGLELPLFGKAEGLFLTAHGGGRFSDRLAVAEAPSPSNERAAFVTFGLAWHELLDVGLAR